MQDKNGWIDKTGWASDGFGEGCTTGDWITSEVIDGL